MFTSSSLSGDHREYQVVPADAGITSRCFPVVISPARLRWAVQMVMSAALNSR